MIAVIKTGGKQYKVSPKDKLKVEKLEGEEGAKIVFDEVLLVSSEDGKDVNIGEPLVEKAKVEAKISKQARAKKVMVIKHKAKKRYNVKRGHRQYFTEVEIEKIIA
ncbi:MAG: 50S ribosomal protein L21 [Candidatus Andersenbacteria bacterium]|nr:50S ribosomal protein L21 [Candidatus Andersenbacteria bacterium]